MKKILLLLFILLIVAPVAAQKDKKKSRVPSLKQRFERFSVFAYQNNSYVHQETNNVWMETFLEVNPKENKVSLPGVGDERYCSYLVDECSFIEDADGIHLIILPIECGTVKQTKILRIHTIHSGRKIEYAFSLGVPEAKDFVLFHNYNDQELSKLLTQKTIRFE